MTVNPYASPAAAPAAGTGPYSAEDRRFRRAQWRVILATMFCYLFFYTGRQVIGFAIPGMEKEFHLSKATLGLASMVGLWCYALGQSINGNLGDKFGGRRMMSLGAVLSCGFCWIVSFGTNLVTIILPYGANGLAQSMAWAPGSRVLANWWSSEERGKVYGLYAFAAGSGSVLAYATSTLILHLGMDWRYIFRLPVLLMLLGGVIYYLLVRDRPEEMGFPPLPDPVESGDSPAASAVDESSLDRYVHALSNPRFLIACLAIGFQSMARYGLLVWVPVYMMGKDWKDNKSAMWISLALPVGMALGAISSGWVSDRLFGTNRSRVISLFMAIACVTSLGMFFLPRTHPAVFFLLLVAGFFTYGPQSAFWALCPDLLGHKRAGTGTGIMNTFAYVFAGLGEPFTGWMMGHFDNNALVFSVVATACAISALIAPLIRR